MHAQFHGKAAGTAFAISYNSDIRAVTPENLVVFSVRYMTPWKRETWYDVPADMPACPPEGAFALCASFQCARRLRLRESQDAYARGGGSLTDAASPICTTRPSAAGSRTRRAARRLRSPRRLCGVRATKASALKVRFNYTCGEKEGMLRERR